MAKHSIDAGYERGIFWRMGQCVPVGEVVAYHKGSNGAKSHVYVAGDFDDVTGDDFGDPNEIHPDLINDAFYILQALTRSNNRKRNS